MEGDLKGKKNPKCAVLEIKSTKENEVDDQNR